MAATEGGGDSMTTNPHTLADRLTNPQPHHTPEQEPPDHWCTCPPDVCRGIGPDEGGCSWCWAKDTDEPCPGAAGPSPTEDQPT